MLRVMDAVWLQNKWDLKMRPYAVCATGVNSHGKGVGMLEIVTNADTTAGIQNVCVGVFCLHHFCCNPYLMWCVFG